MTKKREPKEKIGTVVPYAFQLFNQNYDVVPADVDLSNRGLWGEIDRGINQIKLCTNYRGDEVCDDRLMGTFFHELAHAILLDAGYDELGHDEKFVDIIGQLMLQAFMSFQYD